VEFAGAAMQLLYARGHGLARLFEGLVAIPRIAFSSVEALPRWSLRGMFKARAKMDDE
jgi:hypothetical protein